MSESFAVEGVEVVFRSHVFDVERRTIQRGGSTFDRDVARHPGAVAVLAINERLEVGFIRQYRAAFDDVLLEIPAGTQDVDDEAPLATAKRELMEELGYEASQWRLLGRFMNSPGWTNQVMTIYEARGLTQGVRAPVGPEESGSSVCWLSRDELRAELRAMPAVDSTTMVALHRVFGTFFDES
ncbi:MAG: NUDIX domain-containing protein [Acidimicrobiales bacterium]